MAKAAPKKQGRVVGMGNPPAKKTAQRPTTGHGKAYVMPDTAPKKARIVAGNPTNTPVASVPVTRRIVAGNPTNTPVPKKAAPPRKKATKTAKK